MNRTYKGRKIVVRARKTSAGRELVATVNGEFARSVYVRPDAERDLLAQVHREIDSIDERPIGGWPLHWYDPVAIEVCPEGHAQPIGGTCSHPWCTEQAETTADATEETDHG